MMDVIKMSKLDSSFGDQEENKKADKKQGKLMKPMVDGIVYFTLITIIKKHWKMLPACDNYYYISPAFSGCTRVKVRI